MSSSPGSRNTFRVHRPVYICRTHSSTNLSQFLAGAAATAAAIAALCVLFVLTPGSFRLRCLALFNSFTTAVPAAPTKLDGDGEFERWLSSVPDKPAVRLSSTFTFRTEAVRGDVGRAQTRGDEGIPNVKEPPSSSDVTVPLSCPCTTLVCSSTLLLRQQ